MAGINDDNSFAENDRAEALNRVLDDVIRRRHKGERLPDSQVIAEHPSLMPDLMVRLQRLSSIQKARAAADATADPATETSTSPPQNHFPLINGDYVILEKLGRGGQADVFKARYRGHITRAVKVFREFANEEKVRETATMLDNLREEKQIVKIEDIGFTEEGKLYLGTEFIDGKTLDVFLEDELRDSSTKPGAVFDLFYAIAKVVSFAHIKGITHADLKPANIIVDDQNQPHIVDFDLARHGVSKAIDGKFMGSLPWAAPEQAAGKWTHVDTRTDVYSLGVILYFMLTGGRFPYAHLDNIAEILQEISRAAVIPPKLRLTQTRHRLENHSGRPLPFNKGLEQVVLKALSRRRADRYCSAGELANEYKKALWPTSTQTECPTEPEEADAAPVATLKWRKWLLLVVAVAACMASAPLVLRLMHGNAPGGVIATLLTRVTSDARKAAPAGLPPRTFSEPISPSSLVPRPVSLQGVKSWTIETRGYRGLARAVAVSPKDGTLAVGSDDGAIRLLPNPATTRSRDGQPIAANAARSIVPTVLLGHSGGIELLEWSADGSRLASFAYDRTLRVWDVKAGRETIKPISAGQTPYTRLCISWDGRFIAANAAGSIDIWNTADGSAMASGLPGSPAVDWLPGTHQLGILQDDGQVLLWDADTPIEPLNQRLANAAKDACLAFSNDGNQYARAFGASGAWTVELREFKSGNIWKHQQFSSQIRQIRWHDESGHLYLSDGATASVWWIHSPPQETGALRPIRKYGIGHIYAAAWLRNGQLALANAGSPGVAIYNVTHGQAWPLIEQASDSCQQVSWSDGGRFLAVAGPLVSGRIAVIDTTSGDQVIRLEGSAGYQGTVAWSPKGSKLLNLNDSTAEVIEAPGRTPLRSFTFSPAVRLSGAAWSPDGKAIALCDANGRAQIWPLSSNLQAPVPLEGSNPCGSNAILSWSPARSYLASTSRTDDAGSIRIWNPANGRLLKEFKQQSRVNSFAWGAQPGMLLAGDSSGQIATWDVQTGVQVRSAALGLGRVLAVVPVPNAPDTCVVSAENQGIFSSDLISAPRPEFVNRSFAYTSIAWDPDHHTLAGGGMVAHLWNTGIHQILTTLVLLSDGRILALGANGDFRSEMEDDIVFVEQAPDGSQRTLTAAAFSAAHHDWRNDPTSVTFRAR